MRLFNRDYIIYNAPVLKPPTWSNPGAVYKRVQWLIHDVNVNNLDILNDGEIKLPPNWTKLTGIFISHNTNHFNPPQPPTLDGPIVGYFILHINGKRSNPVQLPIQSKTANLITRNWQPLKLDEDIVGTTRVQFEVRNDINDILKFKVYLKGVSEHRR